MLKASRRWGGLAIAMEIAGFAFAQVPAPLEIYPYPVGLRPLGIAIAFRPLSPLSPFRGTEYIVTANSGDNSVSFLVAPSFALESVATGIPSPYAVAACPIDSSGFSTPILVTSPSDNSVRVLGVGRGSVDVSARVQTGLQPHAVACRSRDGIGLVSNIGDSSLTVFEVSSGRIIATIPGVPGSRGFHGIAIYGLGSTPLAAVAGTDANVVTVVDLNQMRVLTQFPVSRPTAVLFRGSSGPVGPTLVVASAVGNSITSYDTATLRAVQFQSVPNPQDLVFSPLLGSLAISGSDSLWRFDLTSLPGTAGPVASIPGAAAFAALVEDRVFVTSSSTNRVYQIRPAPSPTVQFRISNGASFATGQVAPGSLASAFVETGVFQNLNASSLPLPRTLGGITLSVGGSLTFDTASSRWVYSSTGSIPAPLLFVGANQINFQVPTGTALADSVPVQLIRPNGSTLLATVNIKAAAPGIFSLSQDGRLQGAVLNADFSQNGIPQITAGARPAPRGGMIQVFATGAGETDPPMLPGEAAPASGNPLFVTRVQPTVTIGGIQARVLFSGMAPAYVGLWQINAEVPANVTPGATILLSITAGGISSNTVTIAVE